MKTNCSTAYVVFVMVEILHRESGKVLHEENAAMVFSQAAVISQYGKAVNYADSNAIAFIAKRKMISILYAKDSKIKGSPLFDLRSRIDLYPTRFDALAFRTDEFINFEQLKFRKKEWEVDFKGPIFNGIIDFC